MIKNVIQRVIIGVIGNILGVKNIPNNALSDNKNSVLTDNQNTILIDNR